MDLRQHLLRQMAFSHATFGPGTRTKGVVDHIHKELAEVLTANGETTEWVDVVILALDGLTRQLAYCDGQRNDPASVAEIACNMIVGKQSRNEDRSWPDWRTAEPDKAIEHVRTPIKPTEDEIAKAIAFCDAHCCGLQFGSERTLCDDPRARGDERLNPCICRESAKAVLALLSSLPPPSDTGEIERLRAALSRIVNNENNKNWRKPEIVQEAKTALSGGHR